MFPLLQDFWKINMQGYSLFYIVGVILCTLFFAKKLSYLIATFVLKLLQKAGRTVYKDAYFKLLIKPLRQFIAWGIIIFAIEKLYLPAAFKSFPIIRHITIGQALHLIAVCVIIFVFLRFVLSIIVYVAYKLEQKANLTQSQGDNQLILFFKDFAKVFLILIGFLLVLKYGLQQNIGNLITGLSIVGAAIALATKESLENLIASFIIFFDKPFEAGDEVMVHQVSGIVEKIGLRSTRIRTPQKTYVTVPNKQMVDSIVDNHSLRTIRKVNILLHLNAQSSFEQITLAKNEILLYLKKIENIQTPTVYFADISKGVLIIQIDYSLKALDYNSFINSKDECNFMMVQILQKNNIQLTTPAV